MIMQRKKKVLHFFEPFHLTSNQVLYLPRKICVPYKATLSCLRYYNTEQQELLIHIQTQHQAVIHKTSKSYS